MVCLSAVYIYEWCLDSTMFTCLLHIRIVNITQFIPLLLILTCLSISYTRPHRNLGRITMSWINGCGVCSPGIPTIASNVHLHSALLVPATRIWPTATHHFRRCLIYAKRQFIQPRPGTHLRRYLQVCRMRTLRSPQLRPDRRHVVLLCRRASEAGSLP